MVWLDRLPVSRLAGPSADGRELFMGAVGLALGASLGALFELRRLLSALNRLQLGIRLPLQPIGKMLAIATVTVVPVLLMLMSMRQLPMLAKAIIALMVYAGLYLATARLVRLPELASWVSSFRRRV